MRNNIMLFGLPHVLANYGCEAIVQGTSPLLKKVMPQCNILYISDSHSELDRKRLGDDCPVIVEDSVRRFSPRFFIRRFCSYLYIDRKRRYPAAEQLKKIDCVLSIGGDLYTFADEEGAKTWPYPWPIVKDGNYIMDKGVPYVIWCASIGPLDRAGKRLPELVEHLKRCAAIIVREETSYNHLVNDLSIKDNVYLAADPAYYMDPEPFEAPFIKENDPPAIAFNISEGSIRQVIGFNNRRYEEICNSYLNCMKKLIKENNYRILLVPHQVTDHEFYQRFYKEISGQYKNMCLVAPNNLGARKTKWLISKCVGLVTIRFHCALAGYGTCTPTLLVLTKPKGAKLVKDIFGDLTYSIELKEMDENALYEKIISIVEKNAEIKNVLMDNLKCMREKAEYAGQLVDQVITRHKADVH